MSVRTLLGPLWPLVRPAFPDSGRLIVQLPALRDLSRVAPLCGRVLNAGCGEGLYCEFIESFASVTRVDNVDIATPPDFLDRHADPRHHADRASLTSLPYDTGAFDAVLCTEVIEHIPDDGAAVAELARVLKPGGVLIASVPQIPAPFDPSHAREGYTIESFRALLASAGLVVEAERSCCHGLLKLVMTYWRRPWLTFSAAKTPYVPNAAMIAIAHADRTIRLGRPWDLVVVARLTSPEGHRRTSS